MLRRITCEYERGRCSARNNAPTCNVDFSVGIGYEVGTKVHNIELIDSDRIGCDFAGRYRTRSDIGRSDRVSRYLRASNRSVDNLCVCYGSIGNLSRCNRTVYDVAGRNRSASNFAARDRAICYFRRSDRRGGDVASSDCRTGDLSASNRRVRNLRSCYGAVCDLRCGDRAVYDVAGSDGGICNLCSGDRCVDEFGVGDNAVFNRHRIDLTANAYIIEIKINRRRRPVANGKGCIFYASRNGIGAFVIRPCIWNSTIGCNKFCG